MNQRLKRLKNNSFFTKINRLTARPTPIMISVVVLSFGLLAYRLTSLVPLSNYENSHALQLATLGEIKANILFAPIKALQFGALKLFDNDVLIRLGSVAIGIMVTILLYSLLRKWYAKRVSILTTVLFISSSWFLHVGRLANPDVLFLAVGPAILLSCLWLVSKNGNKRLPIATILLALTLYIPGTWLLLIAGLITFRKFAVGSLLKLNKKGRIACGILMIGSLSPLIYSFYLYPKQIILWLGYNTDQALSGNTLINNVVSFFDQLFWRGNDNGALWLYGTAVLDIFSVAMFVLGLYAFRAGYYPLREKIILGSLILCSLIVILGGVASISLVLPFIYIVIANGLAYMLQSWFTVFPRNPVARPIGVIILSVTVLLSCAFNIHRYFVAWPSANQTTIGLSNQYSSK